MMFVDEIISEETQRRQEFDKALSLINNMDSLSFYEAYDTLKNEHNSIIRHYPDCWKLIFKKSKFLSTAKETKIGANYARFDFDDYSVELPLSLVCDIHIIVHEHSAESLASCKGSKNYLESHFKKVCEALDEFQNNFRLYQLFKKSNSQYMLAVEEVSEALNERVNSKWLAEFLLIKKVRNKKIDEARKRIISRHMSVMEGVNQRIIAAEKAAERRRQIIDNCVDNLSEFKDSPYMKNLVVSG